MKKANRALSQNFMNNTAVIDRVKIEMSMFKTGSMLEIGPGNGEFTSMLLGLGDIMLNLVEKDDILSEKLSAKFFEESRVKVINKDILDYDILENAVFSSVPYSLSKEIIKKIVLSKSVNRAFLIVQKEFGEKLAFENMSSISLFARTFFEVKKLFNISRNSFSPAPRVDSCFITMERKEHVKDNMNEYWLFLTRLTSNRLKKASSITEGSGEKRINDLSIEEIIKIYADKYIHTH